VSVVLRTAAEMVDDGGWRALTMTALAAQLGVRGPTLYSHVENLEGLLSQVQTGALRDLGSELQRAAMGRSGPDGIRSLGAVLRDFALRHPGRYELAMTEPIDQPAMVDAGLNAGGALTAMIRSFGVEMVEYELMFLCLSTLHGVLVLDRAGLFRGVRLDLDETYASAVELVVHLCEEAAAT
jgi:AcrR family transcriptional regulator